MNRAGDATAYGGADERSHVMRSSGRPALNVSNVQEIAWPPIALNGAAVLGAVLRQIGETQWMAPADIETRQRGQLALLAEHCARTSPFFQRRLRDAGLAAGDLATPGGLRRLPVMDRRMLQSASDLFCTQTPEAHLPVRETSTSGSTGEPVVVRRTAVSSLLQFAFVLRGYAWHGRDLAEPVCSIRPVINRVERRSDWGLPANQLYETGPALNIPGNTDLAEQLRLIEAFEPRVLTIAPNNLLALARLCSERGRGLPSLRHASTISETLSDEVREEVGRVLGIRITDTYSTQELGCVAIECPQSGLYHVMAESMLVEVLGRNGEPCKEGEAGRLAITDLTNFATPLIRYDIGDWAEQGPLCPCGRGLPTLRRILGRERNLILLPDGRRYWPRIGYARFRQIAPIQQLQIVQDSRETIDLRLVVQRPLTEAEESQLTTHVQTAMGWPFRVRFTYVSDRIPAGPGGKYEDVMCLVS